MGETKDDDDEGAETDDDRPLIRTSIPKFYRSPSPAATTSAAQAPAPGETGLWQTHFECVADSQPATDHVTRSLPRQPLFYGNQTNRGMAKGGISTEGEVNTGRVPEDTPAN